MERETLWRLVVETKFDNMRGDWCSKEIVGPFGVGVWKHIKWGWGVFLSFMRYEVLVQFVVWRLAPEGNFSGIV